MKDVMQIAVILAADGTTLLVIGFDLMLWL
jgi:hypothetical protein